MQNTLELLTKITDKIQPGTNQNHSLIAKNGKLMLCLMMGKNCLPIIIPQDDFNRPVDELIEEIEGLI